METILKICLKNNLQKFKIKSIKSLTGNPGLYEARIKLGSNIWRVFCFFDKGKLVILLNGYLKKSDKTDKQEINKANNLMKHYFNEKV